MKIAIDYDGTWDRDHAMWVLLAHMMQSNGHEVYIVTMRKDDRANEIRQLLTGLQVINTSQCAKADAMAKLGINIDVWIDDEPLSINLDRKDMYGSDASRRASDAAANRK
jgi:hypothetical protein